MKILIEESVLRQALEALELAMYQQVKQKSAITALRTALDAAKLGADKGEK